MYVYIYIYREREKDNNFYGDSCFAALRPLLNPLRRSSLDALVRFVFMLAHFSRHLDNFTHTHTRVPSSRETRIATNTMLIVTGIFRAGLRPT